MKTFFLFTALLSFTFLVNAQEVQKDTVRLHLYDLQNPNIYWYDDFEPEYGNFSDLDFLADKGNIRLYSSFILSASSKDHSFSDASPHFLSNYHRFYIENSRISPVTYILGMAQLSAVGYLAYKHIKKYGLR